MTLDDTTLDDTTSVLSIEDVTTKTGKMGAPSDAGVHLQWRDVTYTVTRKASKKPIDASSDADTPNVEVKTILSHISGEAKGGSLLALMGPSGSGKTSLLNALAFRVPRGPGPPACAPTAARATLRSAGLRGQRSGRPRLARKGISKTRQPLLQPSETGAHGRGVRRARAESR